MKNLTDRGLVVAAWLLLLLIAIGGALLEVPA